MKFATIVFLTFLFAAAAYSQEPVNHAVSQPTAHQAMASQPAASQVTTFQSVPGPIPTAFVPLPTMPLPSIHAATPVVAAQPSAPSVPKPGQPVASGSK